jgi:hypothetical protein
MRGMLQADDDGQPRSEVVDGLREDFTARTPRALVDFFVFGIFPEPEFELARSAMIDLDPRLDYADWIDLREGGQIALSWAGANVATIAIAAQPFLRWCRLNRRAPSETSLDAFAAIVQALQDEREIAVLARVNEADFSRSMHAVSAFADAGDFSLWSQRRGEARARAEREGRRIEEMSIDLDDFEAWRACIGETGDERAIDAYARLLLEELAIEATTNRVNQNSLS